MTTYAPRTLGVAGRRLWRAVTGTFALEEFERLLLREACRTADLIEKLAAEAEASDAPGRVLVELRQQRLTLAKQLGGLKVPADGRPASGSAFRNRAPNLRQSE